MLTTNVNVAVSPELRRRLKVAALKQHRSLSGLIRMLLEESLEFLEPANEEAERNQEEYEIRLTTEEATRLLKKGYTVLAV